MSSKQTLTGVMLMFLLMLLQSCAMKAPVIIKPVQCLHPVIDVRKNSGLVLAIDDYRSAVDLCNTLNGY